MSCDPVALAAKLNEAENALGRAMRAANKSNFAKVWIETKAGIAFANEALAMCHDDAPHEHEPPPATDVLASSVPLIASNFDKASWIAPAGIPPSNAPDVVGAFRMTGNVSHYNYDDPLVYPGKPGAAHLHEYVGNTLTDAHSNYDMLRTTGGGTTEGGPINRSAYWQPPLLLGDMVAVPKYVTIYYKRLPIDSPRLPAGAEIAPLPKGLRMLTQGGSFKVHGKTGDLTSMVEALKFAEPGLLFYTAIHFPHWWNGQHIDSLDHMSHMSHQFSPTHRFLIPTISLIRAYDILPGEDWSKAELASDRAMGAAPGMTWHADYWEAWDTPTFREIEAHALDNMLNCSGGNMGSGRQLKRPPGWTFDQKPNRIPLSEMPKRLIL